MCSECVFRKQRRFLEWVRFLCWNSWPPKTSLGPFPNPRFQGNLVTIDFQVFLTNILISWRRCTTFLLDNLLRIIFDSVLSSWGRVRTQSQTHVYMWGNLKSSKQHFDCRWTVSRNRILRHFFSVRIHWDSSRMVNTWPSCLGCPNLHSVRQQSFRETDARSYSMNLT